MARNSLKTMADIDREYQAKEQALKRVEAKLTELHILEDDLRTELQHLEIQRERLKQLQASI